MKHNIITLLSGVCLLSAFALAGCTKAILEPSGFPEDGVVRISTGAPLTKAEGSSSAYEGTTLGLYVNYGVGESYTNNNIQWTNESGEWTPVDQMLWKNPTEGPTLWAYAPYNASQLLPNQDSDFGKLEFTIPEDQSAGITQADFVTWGQQNYIPDHNKNANFSEDGKVQVNFSHNLVKLTFNFTIRTQFEPGTTISKATLLGTTSKVSCEIFGSTVAESSDAVSRDIVLHKVSDLVFEGIFFPGDGQKAGSKMLEVEMSDADGTVLTYTVGNADLNFESGKAYTMNMYLGKHEVEMSKVTLEPWVNSGTVINVGNGSETAVPAWSGSVASSFESVSGTQDDPYIIKTGEQLAFLAQQVNAGTNYSGVYFKLSNSINLAGKDWTPIGNSSKQFKGKFDGNGNRIYGLKVNSESSYAGLFGYAGAGSEISNLSVIEADIATSQSFAGAICGYLNSGTISNCSVVGGSVSAGLSRSGGICGQSYGSAKIENCSVSSTSISASSIAGGICGEISGSLESCKGTDLEITAVGWVGGITAACQNNISTTLKNCSIYSSKILLQEPNSNDYALRAGGLVAYCRSSNLTISDCSSQVDFKIANTSYQRFIGGLFGCIYESGTFTNCHFDGCFMNKSGEVIDYYTASDSYTNYSGTSLTLGAAIGGHLKPLSGTGTGTFTNCSYNASKTGNIPVVKTSLSGQDYSGIIAK
ncbi:MAG: fimbrillin family protein [Candidatus Cryptobacteroides sp.]